MAEKRDVSSMSTGNTQKLARDPPRHKIVATNYLYKSLYPKFYSYLYCLENLVSFSFCLHLKLALRKLHKLISSCYRYSL